MYDNYSFYMDWSDLPGDFQEEKIDEYICKEFHKGDYGDEVKTESEALNSKEIRRDAERCISARFPIYF